MKIIKDKQTFYIVQDDIKKKIEIEVVQKHKLYLNYENVDVKIVYQDNLYQYYYKLALKRLAKMQSEYMLYTYLESKEAPANIIKQVIHQLKQFHYLDDFDYAKNYVDLKKNTYGPRKIQSKLIEDHIKKNIIDEVLRDINEEEILDGLISRELTKIKTSIKSFKQKLLAKYYSRGFSLDVVLKVVNKQINNISHDDTIYLKKDYDKLKNRKTKLSETDFKYQIRTKLLQKGYHLDDIKKVEEM